MRIQRRLAAGGGVSLSARLQLKRGLRRHGNGLERRLEAGETSQVGGNSQEQTSADRET